MNLRKKEETTPVPSQERENTKERRGTITEVNMVELRKPILTLILRLCILTLME